MNSGVETGDLAPPQPKPRFSNLTLRVMTALILGPIVLAGLVLGGPALLVVLVLLTLTCMQEWIRMIDPTSAGWRRDALIAWPVAAVLVAALSGPLASLSVLLVGAIVLTVARRGAWIALGAPYVALASVAILWLRGQPEIGLALALFAVLVVWATDIGAYAAGRAIGGAKLWARVSPNKTWAGLVGGAVAAALVGAIVGLVAGARLAWLVPIVAALVAVVAQLGDLFESATKRRVGRKDSGALFPGHGGVLDRVDGLLTALPAVALFHAVLGPTIQWWQA